jgi:hypothetical protein
MDLFLKKKQLPEVIINIFNIKINKKKKTNRISKNKKFNKSKNLKFIPKIRLKLKFFDSFNYIL